MTEEFAYLAPASFWGQVKKLVAGGELRPALLDISEPRSEDIMPPVRFITLAPYSTYAIRQYPSTGYDSYDLDTDNRGGQSYSMMVDGETPVPVALQHYEWEGNHKQLISLAGDAINGVVKLALGEYETAEISVNDGDLTAAVLTAALEALPNIGRGNVKTTIYPGRWLVEFIGQLAGQKFDLIEVDRAYDAEFEVLVMETKWNDSGESGQVIFPIPLAGKYDGDDNVINDAVAAGAIGTADTFPGAGRVVNAVECRDYNGDGTPNL